MKAKYDNIMLKKFRLLGEFRIESDIIPPNGEEIDTTFAKLCSRGTIILRPGFCSDGFTFAPDIECAMDAAFVHDFICWLVDKKLLPIEYRKKGDDLFKDMLIGFDIPDAIVDVYYNAVVGWGQIKHAG
jgi:hypothetical protein